MSSSAQSVERPERARRPFSFRVVGGVLLLTLLLALAAGIYIYGRYVHYDRIVLQHLPSDSLAAVRLDVEKVVVYEPVRKHLLPLIDEFKSGAGIPARLKRLQSRTKVELGIDLREAVFAVGPGMGDWLCVLGGKFPKRGVVEGVTEVLNEEGQNCRMTATGEATCGSGLSIAQASDGAVIVGSSIERVRSALPKQSAYVAFGLDPAWAGGFMVSANALQGVLSANPLLLLASGPVLGGMERVTGNLAFDADVTLELAVKMAAGSSAGTQERRIEELLGWALQSAGGGGQTLDLTPTAAGDLRGQVRWSREQFDAALGQLASALRVFLR